jgi:hypothetical protein
MERLKAESCKLKAKSSIFCNLFEYLIFKLNVKTLTNRLKP